VGKDIYFLVHEEYGREEKGEGEGFLYHLLLTHLLIFVRIS